MAILVDIQCNNCETVFEEFYKEGIHKIYICPNCKSLDTKKLVSSPAQLNTNFADKPKHRSSSRFRK